MLARILFLVGALLLGTIELEAQPVTVVGPVTAGNCAQFSSTTVIKDSGGGCGGGGGGAVNSVFGRTGVVVANMGDYSFSQISGSIVYGQMPTSGITIGTYGSATQVPQCTFNAQGIATSCANVAIASNNFVPSGTGATTRSMQAKTLEGFISPTDFGAACDGATDDTTALNNWRIQLQSNPQGFGYVPGVCIVASTSALNFTSGNITIVGAGQGKSGFKAKNSAALADVLQIQGTSQFNISNLTIDGNRANAGTSAVLTGMINIQSPNVTFDNVEVTRSIENGFFVGSNSANPFNVRIVNSTIHDNGGVSGGGIGTGLYCGGSNPPADLRIVNNRWENNTNTVTGPGQSGAINCIGTDVQIIGNVFVNNLNVNGGQVAVSDSGTGATSLHNVIANNIVLQTTTFGGDITAGIEVDGGQTVVSGNNIWGVSSDGVRVEGTATGVLVEGNIIAAGSGAGVAGVNFINSGGTGVNKSAIRNNHIMSGNIGINLQTTAGGNVVVDGNYIDAAVVNKIGGPANGIIGNNYGVPWPTATAVQLVPNAGSITTGGDSAFVQSGKMVTVGIDAKITNISGGPTSVQLILPVAPKRFTTIIGREVGVTGRIVMATYNAGATNANLIDETTGTAWAPALNNEFQFNVSYEAN